MTPPDTLDVHVNGHRLTLRAAGGAGFDPAPGDRWRASDWAECIVAEYCRRRWGPGKLFAAHPGTAIINEYRWEPAAVWADDDHAG